ncbi:hypothetical protein ACNKHT_05945 [Shigella flexneri]
MFARIKQIAGQEHIDPLQTEIGSMVYAVKQAMVLRVNRRRAASV